MELRRLDHVSLNVRDRSRSIAWYSDVLGLEQRGRPRSDDWPVFMGDLGACVALFQARVESPDRAPESTGLRHVAFMVGRDDLPVAQERLRDHGVDFRFEDHRKRSVPVLPRSRRQRDRADVLQLTGGQP